MKSSRNTCSIWQIVLNLDNPGFGDVALLAALDLMPVEPSWMVELLFAKSADVPFLRLWRWLRFWLWLWAGRNNNSKNIIYQLFLGFFTFADKVPINRLF